MTKLEKQLETENPEMENCREIYGTFDEKKRIVANFAYMDLVRRIKIMNFSKVSAAELAVKLVHFGAWR